MPDNQSLAFEKLHRSVQRWIWEQGWTELRDAQEAAVEPILSGNQDVIIAATTASGKTEAAFLPIGSVLASQPGGEALALYISPLKALINDQFNRLGAFFEHLGFPAIPWHGDVGPAKKKQFLKNPRGVLLITPESLEGLFVRQGLYIHTIFRFLRYVVVDELHSFIGTERGRQLQSLLHRIEVEIERKPPRIGLSATLGDMALAAEFLRPAKARNVHLLVSTSREQEIKLLIRGFESRVKIQKQPPSSGGTDEEEVPDEAVGSIGEDIFKSLRGSTNLVFANSRANVEQYSDLLRRRCEQERLPNEFWPHHGSLSKEIREHAEAALKDQARPATAVCTSTLELGIDIGVVKSIAQIGPPNSVSSVRQRLGRSGRRGEPAILRVYVEENELLERTHPIDALRPSLVQAVAVIRLLLAKWCEPPNAAGLQLSTLTHQLLSLIAQHGGVSAAKGWKDLCREGPFKQVDVEMFKRLLAGMVASDLIFQDSEGLLLPAMLGEKIINHYSFLTVFMTSEEYELIAGDKVLGTIPIDRPLKVNSLLIFAGKRWKIVKIEEDRRLIHLVRASGGRVPTFTGLAGRLHDRIRKEMKLVYKDRESPRFLDSTANRLLSEGKSNFLRFQLQGQPFLALGDDTIFFPWAGDRIVDTIAVQLEMLGFTLNNEGIALQIDSITPDLLRKRFVEVVANGPADAIVLAESVKNKLSEKYHFYLPEDLLDADYASSRLDTIGAWETLKASLL